MTNNIGLDFGTSYTVVSRLKNMEKNKKGEMISLDLEACLPNEGALSPYQDSVVLRNPNGTLTFGPLTRAETGRKGMLVYKGFKMMLAETDQDVLTKRGYDETYTPEYIVKKYLDDILHRYIDMSNLEENRIDKVVIGVPEIWFSDASTINCRTLLESIVSSFPYVNQVELVSEPAAACAFFVFNYKKNIERRYKGKILLVDYGGGTLDIALCDVHENGQSSEVSVIKRCGAGLNEEGFIGKAGMAFIEAAVKLALKPLGLDDKEILENRKFYVCVNFVEDALMNKMKDIRDTFGSDELTDRSTLDDVFCTIEFGEDNMLDLTYGMLATAYNQIIQPVLDEKLDEIIEYMENNDINYLYSELDDFKIAPVGGFCNFYLTQEQIEKKFGRYTKDKRFIDIITDRRDCEKAVSYGASLIANEIIEFKQLSPYHLGIARGSEREIRDIYYAIHKGDDIVYDKPIFIQAEDGEEILFQGANIPLLVVNIDDNCSDSYLLWDKPLKEYKKAFKLDLTKCYKIGFSLDRSMIITLHKHVIDLETNTTVEKSSERLNDIYSIIGNLFVVRGA
ncbi:MAG TPA: hypothetical protein DIW17_06875, partial [Clostridiales bacterium]|nr:hypothetical protein [Clostridiales bacterium]